MITIPSASPDFRAAVVKQNRVGDGRGRGVWCAFGEHYFDVVCRKHFQRARKCGLGQSVSIHPEEQRPVNVLEFAVVTNRLSDGQDVPLVERHVDADPRWPDVPKTTRCLRIDSDRAATRNRL